MPNLSFVNGILGYLLFLCVNHICLIYLDLEHVKRVLSRSAFDLAFPTCVSRNPTPPNLSRASANCPAASSDPDATNYDPNLSDSTLNPDPKSINRSECFKASTKNRGGIRIPKTCNAKKELWGTTWVQLCTESVGALFLDLQTLRL